MIVLQNITKYYYTDTSVTQALRKINLEFHVGEFVAITGESGSGKSTLLNIISGMDTFDDGELYFDGEPTFQFDSADWEEFRRDKIGFVFQNYNLIGSYSALDNVMGALLIMGMEETEAREKAKQYLEKVGLKGFEKQRASELSSGQKQRLSIARALAKDTSIIVADEPTGNLDSETGSQIIELLKEISENKLVIMVTHNYEQAAPYVTRKVRLHDGEVVVDVKENQTAEDENSEEKKQSTEEENTIKEQDDSSKDKVAEKAYKKQQNKIAKTFAAMNSRTQIGRALLFRVFFLFTAIVSFLFIGQLYKNADDTSTKDYNKSIFYQKNDSRLSVKRADGKAITSKDIQKMQSVRNVVQVDQYDYVNDINYYVEEGKDYKITYDTNPFLDNLGKSDGFVSDLHVDYEISFLNDNMFMKSSTCISKEDLAEGRMPKSRYEVVLYAKDSKKAKLGKEIEIYFTAKNIMGSDEYYHNRFKVVGLLKEETEQIYFHSDFCHMISAPIDGDEVTLEYYFNFRGQEYLGENNFYLIVGEGLEGSDMRVSRNYIVPTLRYDYDQGPVEQIVPGNDQFTFKLNADRKGYSDELEALDNEPIKVQVLNEFNEQSGLFMEVSEEFYEKYFSRESLQASVYIKNYTKTDKVIKALEKMGYIAVSTYRISSVEYNPEKVMDRLVFIMIALTILFVLIAVEILILRSLMKIKIKDYYVFKSMGMRLGMIKKVSFYEMTRYCIEAIAITVILMLILNVFKIPMLNSMMIYYGVFAYVTFIIYNLGLEFVTVWSFNRLLKGRMAS